MAAPGDFAYRADTSHTPHPVRSAGTVCEVPAPRAKCRRHGAPAVGGSGRSRRSPPRRLQLPWVVLDYRGETHTGVRRPVPDRSKRMVASRPAATYAGARVSGAAAGAVLTVTLGVTLVTAQVVLSKRETPFRAGSGRAGDLVSRSPARAAPNTFRSGVPAKPARDPGCGGRRARIAWSGHTIGGRATGSPPAGRVQWRIPQRRPASPRNDRVHPAGPLPHPGRRCSLR